MSEDLGRAGLPIRHAGSFGFDFAATEWFCDPASRQYFIRISVPDLPPALCDDLTDAIAEWSLTKMRHRKAPFWKRDHAGRTVCR
jgi:hypothetical protein